MSLKAKQGLKCLATVEAFEVVETESVDSLKVPLIDNSVSVVEVASKALVRFQIFLRRC